MHNRFFIALLLLASFCWAENALGLKHRMRIGGEDEDLILRWAGIATDDAGFIYITDMQDYSIKKFDQAGKLVAKTGRQGQGPGEFTMPGGIVCAGKTLYVFQIQALGVQLFDLDLNYLKTISTSYFIGDSAVVGGDYYISSMMIDSPDSIARVDEAGQLELGIKKESATLDQKKIETMFQRFNAFVVTEKKEFYLSYNYQNKVAHYDARHNLIKEVSFPDFDIKSEKVGEGSQAFSLPVKTCFKDVQFGPGGLLFVLCGTAAPIKRPTIYVLNRELEKLSELHLKESSHAFLIDNKGRTLYARAEEGMAIDVYDIVVNR